MNKLALTLLALAFPVLHATFAQATNDRSWVASAASGGNDANSCVRTSPCATFGAALTATNAGGEINCVDQGEFAVLGLNITQSITIDCVGVQARVTQLGVVSAILVNAAATDIVVLRGISVSGTSQGSVGISFLTGAALHVEKCVVNYINGNQFGWGIALQAFTASATMELYVSDTVVTNNNGGANSAGIIVFPLASNTINKVILNRVEARNNKFGIKADGAGGGIANPSGGVINMTVRDSVASGNTANGIVGTSNSTGAAVVWWSTTAPPPITR